jgi:hypothetical protein
LWEVGKVRFRRSEGIPITRREKKPIGRPTGWRKEDVVCTTIRVSENLKIMLEYERRPDERYNDTIQRILREKMQTIQKLRQEIDELKLLIGSH